jgi:tRNA(Ile)-lysidine synthase TilS/MesJ
MARPLGIVVTALHVHHGLNPAADRWLAHGRALCARWARRGLAVEFAATKLEDGPGAGESVEAWARQARYRALRQMALDLGIDLSCSPTIVATRPRPSCCRPCAAAASPGCRRCRDASGARA